MDVIWSATQIESVIDFIVTATHGNPEITRDGNKGNLFLFGIDVNNLNSVGEVAAGMTVTTMTKKEDAKGVTRDGGSVANISAGWVGGRDGGSLVIKEFGDLKDGERGGKADDKKEYSNEEMFFI